MRTRFALLWCYSGVLRSETLFLGELSDLVDLQLQRRDYTDMMEITVMQMTTGKTVSSNTKQYRRAMRHVNPKRCAVGALALYLFYRFYYSGEMDADVRPDFTKNRTWYQIKLLTNGSKCNNIVAVSRRSYTDKIRNCFKSLHIYASAFGHWGRIAAPPLMELEEVPPEFIRIMGKLVTMLQLFLLLLRY